MAKNTQTNPSAPSAPKSLDALRDDLDQFDQRILQLINERAAVAQTIGEAKRAAGDQIYDPRREAEVIERAVLRNDGPLGDHSVQAVFREIVSGARAIQAPMRVAYLGPEFTFSHLAAIQQFGDSADLAAVTTIASVFEEVERGQADYGVVPMENSTDGRVSDTLECFARSTLRICAELPVGIHHCLMGVGSQDEIEIVHSKPQALSQCRNWLAQHLPNAVVRPVGSTAEAAVYARANPKMAAVGSERLGANYDLKVFARNIEDNAQNETRFGVSGTESYAAIGHTTTQIMINKTHQYTQLPHFSP